MRKGYEMKIEFAENTAKGFEFIKQQIYQCQTDEHGYVLIFCTAEEYIQFFDDGSFEVIDSLPEHYTLKEIHNVTDKVKIIVES